MPELSARSVVKHLTGNTAVWLGLLCASALLTAAYTCVTPFAAFAVIATAALSRRDALLLVGALWLVNQTVGFAWLHYPWTATTFAWSIAIGAAAMSGTLCAQSTIERLSARRSSVQVLAAFLFAFAGYELALYGAAVLVLGGRGAFTIRIIVEVLFINAVTLVGLLALRELAGVLRRAGKRPEIAPADFA
jgi:hypothetical protein